MFKRKFETKIALRTGGFDTWRLQRHYSTTVYLWQIRREVDLVSDGEIQHIIRADGHRADGTRCERIALARKASELILKFERTRREAEDFSVFRIEQEEDGVGRSGDSHLREVRLREDVDILMRREIINEVERVNAFGWGLSDAAERASGNMPVGMKHVEIVAAYGKVNGGVERVRNLIAEIKIWCINERAFLPDVHPDRT